MSVRRGGEVVRCPLVTEPRMLMSNEAQTGRMEEKQPTENPPPPPV